MRHFVEQVGITFEGGSMNFCPHDDGQAVTDLVFEADGFCEGHDESGAREYSHGAVTVYATSNVRGGAEIRLTGAPLLSALAYLKRYEMDEFNAKICADAEEASQAQYEVAA